MSTSESPLSAAAPGADPHSNGALSVLIVGAGRVGTALAHALTRAGTAVFGPIGRGSGVLRDAIKAHDPDVVLLAVPDSEIAKVAGTLIAEDLRGRLLGHLSGATGLDVLGSHGGFSLHPFMTITKERAPFAGAAATIQGTSPRAEQTAEALLTILQMRRIHIRNKDRAAYHAVASIASNFFMTLEGFAEQLAESIGMDRSAIVPLVQASLDNWAADGAARSLTGPIARGDDATVQRQRDAIAARLPEQLPLFDALVTATRSLAQHQSALEE